MEALSVFAEAHIPAPNHSYLQSGGKFDPAKEAAQQLRADYFSEPMSVRMVKQFAWHSEMGINELHAGRADVRPGCENLNPVTRAVLTQVFSGRNISKVDLEHMSRCASNDLLFGGEPCGTILLHAACYEHPHQLC